MALTPGEGSDQPEIRGLAGDTTAKDYNTMSRTTEDAASQPPKNKSVWRRVVGLVWDSVEGDERNRKYVQKLDGFLLLVL